MTAFSGKIQEERSNKSAEQEEEIMLEESWPHIQIVYELLLRLIILKQYDAKSMLQGIESKSVEPQFTNDFVLKLIGLF
jgi:hypothetical protein